MSDNNYISDFEPTLSVVVPVYNGELYIKKCFDNIYEQTYGDYEVIFVDDGSTDGSANILDECVARDPRFSVIHKANGGTAHTRNAGLDVARGKYIMFLDCDDEYCLNYFERMVRLVQEYDSELVICGFYFKIENDINGHSKVSYLEEKKYGFRFFKTFEEMRPEYIKIWDSDLFSNVWNKLYSMDTIKKHDIRFRDGHVYTEDRVFNRLFLSKCQSVVLDDECLYYYIRERVGSTTEKYRDDSFQIRNKEYHEFRSHFEQMNIWNDVSKEYTCREFVERIAGCIENVFHAGTAMSLSDKYQKIKSMVEHEDVQEAIIYAKCKSIKMKLFLLPVKLRWATGAYIMGATIYLVRKSNPALFHRLKSRR